MLQEASAPAIADGFPQATRTLAFLNLHTALCCAMRSTGLVNMRISKTPMILRSGPQTRKMLLMKPCLTNLDAPRLSASTGEVVS